MNVSIQKSQKAESRLQLSEVISALSYALDLTEGQPAGHCVRACWIGTHIGLKLGLSQNDLWDLYYTLLLKDAGCSSNAARLCELYGSDDRIAKHDIKVVNTDNMLQLVKYVVAHTGMRDGLANQFKRIIHIASHGEQIATSLITTRCERGAAIARKLGFSGAVASGIHSLDEHWDGHGKPEKLAGQAISIHSRIALLAQVIEVFYQIGGKGAALLEVRRRNESWFDPDLVEIVNSLADDRSFWSALRADDIEQRVLALEPESKQLLVNDDLLDQISEAFGQVVDAKSPYTAGHSHRVALYTDIIARNMGFDSQRRRWLKRGALLHDLGKLGVSNSILDKNGKLDAEEWLQVRKHPVYTSEILSRIAAFHEVAFVAGAHHERLDGKGYPDNLNANEIPLETRIITISDIFDAITADRPYRGPIPVPEAIEIMGRMVGSALDKQCYAVLISCLDEILERGKLETSVK